MCDAAAIGCGCCHLLVCCCCMLSGSVPCKLPDGGWQRDFSAFNLNLTFYCHFVLLCRHYFQNTQGLIFVVDSNDRDRAAEARDEL